MNRTHIFIYICTLITTGLILTSVGWHLGYQSGHSVGRWDGMQEGQDRASEIWSELLRETAVIEIKEI